MSRFVGPFYRQLMGFNAADAPPDLIVKVRAQSRQLSAERITQLLQMHWRPRVMGAWYAVAAQDASLSAAVHDSLSTCLGHLTSPPLITAALAYPNAATASLLRDYIEADQRMHWGAAGFAAAALGRLETESEGAARADPLIRAEDRDTVSRLADFGRALQVR